MWALTSAQCNLRENDNCSPFLLCLTYHNIYAEVVKAGTGHSVTPELAPENGWQLE